MRTKTLRAKSRPSLTPTRRSPRSSSAAARALPVLLNQVINIPNFFFGHPELLVFGKLDPEISILTNETLNLKICLTIAKGRHLTNGNALCSFVSWI